MPSTTGLLCLSAQGISSLPGDSPKPYMLPCLLQVFLQEKGPHPAPSCQDEASASRATLRMTTMAAAAVVRAPWQEARAPCLKTVLSGRSRARGPSFCCLCGWRQDTWSRGLVLPVFTPVRTPGARMLPSLPTVSRGHLASV